MSFGWTPRAAVRGGPPPVVTEVLYDFDGPRMVLAVDRGERQLLGVAADEDADGTVRWVYAPASPERTLALIDTGQGLRALFDRGPLEIVDVDRLGEARAVWSVAADDVPRGLLPDDDAVLPELVPAHCDALKASQERLLARRGAARTSLLFSGRPVHGQRAIAAGFAGEMLTAYQDLVSLGLGQRRKGALKTTGPIPARAESALLVADMPRGSVGFELVEDVETANLLPTLLAEVVAELGALLDAIAADDQSYAEAVADFDPRVIGSAASFLAKLKREEATMRLEVPGRAYAFDAERVAQAATRSASAPELEDDRPVVGTLWFLPAARRFELQTTQGVLRGKVARDADVDEVTRRVSTRCTAHLRIVTVGATRGYTLLRVEDAKPDQL